MPAIRSIICCCSNGLGSSMIMEMNIKRALAELDRNKVEVKHIPLSEANSFSDELYVVGLDIAPQMKDFKRVVVIQNMVSTEEFMEKLEKAFSCTDKKFRIE